jgi:hypothetical protein
VAVSNAILVLDVLTKHLHVIAGSRRASPPPGLSWTAFGIFSTIGDTGIDACGSVVGFAFVSQDAERTK